MTRLSLSIVLVLLCTSAAWAQESSPPNTLTPAERAAGWELLFDGETTDGWRGYNEDTFPNTGWHVEDGELRVTEAGSGGDIVTTETYDDFVLKLEWKISEAGNSGVFYRALEQEGIAIYWSAPELQLLDNANHPDAGRGENGNRKAGSLYDLIPADPQTFTGPGEWQETMIVADGPKIEHWMNGKKVLEYTLWTPDWYEMIRNSKFADHPEFGDPREGHIGLQDHGTRASFRNIMIKEL